MTDWKMPEWMREVLNKAWSKLETQEFYHQYEEGIPQAGHEKDLLEQLRKHYLLLTPSERDAQEQRIAELEEKQRWIDEVSRPQHPDDERPWCACYLDARARVKELMAEVERLRQEVTDE
jgi:hypothetical protein